MNEHPYTIESVVWAGGASAAVVRPSLAVVSGPRVELSRFIDRLGADLYLDYELVSGREDEGHHLRVERKNYQLEGWTEFSGVVLSLNRAGEVEELQAPLSGVLRPDGVLVGSLTRPDWFHEPRKVQALSRCGWMAEPRASRIAQRLIEFQGETPFIGWILAA